MEELLREMECFAEENHVPIINEQGRKFFLEVLKRHEYHSVLEIGTAIGYSTLLIAMNGADDVKITTLELSEERFKQAESYIKRSMYADKIIQQQGDASELLEDLKGCFDFVFIDAAKGQYLHYLQLIMPLLADKAVIVTDNVLFRGYVRSEEKPPRRYKTIVKRLREYIEVVTTRPEFSTEIHENGDGLAVSYYDKSKIDMEMR